MDGESAAQECRKRTLICEFMDFVEVVYLCTGFAQGKSLFPIFLFLFLEITELRLHFKRALTFLVWGLVMQLLIHYCCTEFIVTRVERVWKIVFNSTGQETILSF